MSLLTVSDVSKTFDNKEILKNISIELHKGELVSLLGISGGGKTTLFNIIAGLTMPDNGNISLNNTDITGVPGNVSYMLQKDLLLPYKTIIDNIALPLILKGYTKKDAYRKVSEYLEQFGLTETEHLYPSQLSGGMRQRAALLRTYLFSEQVALLDEPFSALDMLTKQEIHQWYLNVMEKIHLSTIFITHDIEEAILLSDRIYILTGQPGQITAEIKINQPKPRNLEFQLSDEFREYKKDILKCLKQNM